MKKNKKITKTIAISALAALTFGSVALTTTYALFTSEANTNVTVASGKVKVSTKIDDDSIKLYSLNETDDSVLVDSSKTSFTSGASFSYDNESGTISLGKFMPGDKVEFTINATNESNVNIKYRTVLKTINDNGLFQGLKVTINDVVYDGSTTISDYASLSANTDFTDTNKAYKFSIELPKEAGDERQDKNCKISFNIEAIQGNAAVTNPDQSSYQIYTPLDLAAFANKINNNSKLQAKDGVYKVYLMNDIDMANIKYVSPNYAMLNTQIEFIGNNKTISNFTPSETVDSSGKYVGLFGKVGSGSAYIHDVNFNNATITGDFTIENEPHLGGGVVVGLTDAGASNLKIENVQLNGNVSVSSVKYGGGLVGYTSCNTEITNCSINTDSTISIEGYTVGGLLGQNGGNTTTISGISISSDVTVDGYRREGGLVGAGSDGTTTTIIFADNNLKDHLKISNKANAAQGTYVGLVSNTTINGVQYYTAIGTDNISKITVADKTKKTILEIGEGEYKGYLVNFNLSGTTEEGGVTVIGRGDKTKITWIQSGDGNNGSNFNGRNVTMENLTLTSNYPYEAADNKVTNGFYTGFPHAASTSFNDVKILVKNEGGAMGLWGDTATFTNCEFYTEADESNMFTYGGTNYTFNKCKFTSTETAIKMYQENKKTETDIYINVNECSFKNTRTVAFAADKNYKSAIQVACDYAGDKVCYNVAIDDKSTIEGNYATGLYNGWIGARYYKHSTYGTTVSSDNIKFTIGGKTPTLSWN